MTGLVTSFLAACSMAAGCMFATGVNAQSEPPEIEWPKAFYDPAADDQADLVLPLPCGGAMNFQKVLVPLDVADLFSDRRVRLGRSDEQTGFATYLRQEFLRGAFEETEHSSFYYVARYELTKGQYRALNGDCAPPDRSDRLAQGGLSWFEAVDLGARYSSWLIRSAAENLPRAGDHSAFVRLPTEVEWEYVARGGAKVDAAQFGQPTFFASDAKLTDFSVIHSANSRQSTPGAIGLRLPNPLGVYDIYGNAEELVLDPFRLNAIGRPHGQAGGVVTRGGSVLSVPEQVNSASRTEYAPFSSETGDPLRVDTVGVRFVLSAPVTTSDDKVRRLQSDWIAAARAATDGAEMIDPLAELERLLDTETDPRRRNAYNELQHSLQVARRNEATLQEQTARSSLLAGAVLVEAVLDNETRQRNKAANIRMLVALRQSGGDAADSKDMIDEQLQRHTAQLAELRRLQQAYLLSIQSVFEVLKNDISPESRATAWNLLAKELSESNQATTGDLLARLFLDYSAYEKRPDMSVEGLREEVLR